MDETGSIFSKKWRKFLKNSARNLNLVYHLVTNLESETSISAIQGWDSLPVIMGCCGMRGLIIWSAIIAGLGYYLYSPIPDGIQEKGKLRIVLAMMRIFNDIGNFVDYIGWMDNITFLRKLFNASAKKILPPNDSTMTMTEQYFDGVRVLVYDPAGRPKNSAAMVYYHGGGWVLMSPEAFDPVTREISRRLNILVVSVDYRLAPEHKFPIPFEDCEKATVYFLKNAAEKFSVDPTRVAVAGDSAGATGAAGIALKLNADNNIPKIRYQVLLFGGYQSMDLMLPSMVEFGKYSLSSAHDAAKYWLLSWGGDLKYIPDVLINNHTSVKIKKDYGRYVNYKDLPPQLIPPGYEPPKTNFGSESISQYMEKHVLDPYENPLMANNLGHMPETYIVCGDSAGGHMSAIMALKHPTKIKAQVLIYPATQGINFNTPSVLQNDKYALPLVTQKILAFYWSSHLTGNPEKYSEIFLTNQHVTDEILDAVRKYVDFKKIPERFLKMAEYKVPKLPKGQKLVAEKFSGIYLNKYVSPLLSDSLKGLPPSLVVTLTYDTIRDDGILYAQRLKQEGNDVQWVNIDDGFHGYISLLNPPIVFDSAWNLVDIICSFLKKKL
ncbi:unnamed protein product [Owenia fusiformis]|uniref:Alpha/beta hydrolase fold-3 domain-containing protein n=1 Tax=Owenia fusiformis TaxID=6347 RepID=A0A8J1UEL9_OWEFU|nr:unnamed protein product [Owenia fusiformis]